MALYDNEHWLLSHIRNSFISSDDTGMCEAVLIDDITKQPNLFKEFEKFPGVEESSSEEDDMVNSFDIQSEYEFGMHRQRTNTAQRLEKMEAERRIAARIKHIKWEVPSSSLSKEEREKLFNRKEVKKRNKDVKVISVLSSEIAQCPNLPKNPFNEYAKYDGNSQVGVLTRTYKIFLTMLSQNERNYPLQVCVLGSAKVQDLIGFICWKYLTQNVDKNVIFKDVNSYGLYIAEDDGEVDWDFSYLDPKETVGKFGLTYLALVELSENHIRKNEREPTKVIAQEEEKKNYADAQDLIQLKGDLKAIEALLYQAFHVSLLSKLRTRTEVVLGISGEKIDIDPNLQNQTKVSGKLWKQKSLSYDIDLIVSCGLLEPKSTSKSVFRISYYNASTVSPDQAGSLSQSGSSNIKHHDFEADLHLAEKIIQKLNNILQLKPGIYRREYVNPKHRKRYRRMSFNVWPR